MRIHATSRIGETGLKIFNGFPIFLNGFQKSSTAFCFPRNPRKPIYGKKYTKDHYLSFVFFATCSSTCTPSFVIHATIPNSFEYFSVERFHIRNLFRHRRYSHHKFVSKNHWSMKRYTQIHSR